MKWKKLGHIFNPTTWNDGIDRPWMKTHSQCVSTLVLEDVVRIYFSCRPLIDKDGQYVSYTTFLELDKNNLTKIIRVSDKPVMPLGELGTFDEFAIYPTSVFKNNDKVLLYYAGWTRCKSTPYTVSIGLGVSDDGGETFKRYSKGPILTNSPFEPFELSGPKVRKINDKFFMYYLAGEKWTMSGEKAESTYKIRLAISDDGINFNKLNKNIIENKLEYECQAGPDVFYLNDRYHMYFTYRHNFDFRNNDRGYRIGYAYSYDAIDWIRDDEQAGIDLSEEGWDSQMHHYPHVFEIDNKWYMLYNGNDFGKYGFGLAILND
jgi:predicted GH43/DUF377 family glycosyl hydrolase